MKFESELYLEIVAGSSQGARTQEEGCIRHRSRSCLGPWGSPSVANATGPRGIIGIIRGHVGA